MFSCAKIVTPSGGPKDNKAPTFVKSNPMPNEINFKGNEIEIEFDEYIVLENPTAKVLISPTIKPTPEITSHLKTVRIKGIDSLKDNTTYIIDFADAIKDYNEGNRLNGFSFAFSTGNHIDTLWFEGRVLDAFELKPVANKFVLLYSNFDTTYIRTNPSDYLTKTDSNGVFKFHNLAQKDYKLIILDDKNQNKIYDLANEGIGFSNQILKPYIADSTAKEKLLNQIFFYTDFVEEKIEEEKKDIQKDTVINDSLTGEYGFLNINLNNLKENSCYIFYLYDTSGKLVQEQALKPKEQTIRFSNLKEGNYKLKLAIDNNCNSKWDKANFSTQEEGEKVLQFNKLLTIKKTWLTEEEWNISE